MLDRRTLLAIVLSALILIFVPILLEKSGLIPKRTARQSEQATPPPPAAPDAAAVSDQQLGAADPSTAAPATPPSPTGPANPFHSLQAAPDRQITVRTNLYAAQLSSRGARLNDVELFSYPSRDKGNVQLDGTPTLRLELGGVGASDILRDAPFEIAESTDAAGSIRKVRLTAADSTGLRITQSYEFQPETNEISLDVQMDGAAPLGITEYRLILTSWPLVTERNVNEDVRSLQAVTKVGKNIKRDSFNDLSKKGLRTHEGTVAWTAVRSKYFTVAAVPIEASAGKAYSDAGQLPFEASEEHKDWQGQQVEAGLVLPVPPPGTTHRFKVYAGPNDYWILKKTGHGLEDVVDLGWRWLLPFSRAILTVMVWFKQYIPNFGLVIIALSALVRLIFHPLNNASLKSMRAMQRIQPEVERIKKKFEKDPQKMNQAVMELYKENKVNPLGGCLPMVVQMPVLIALYQVFLHAIDLRQASFFLWINDLSTPDVLFTVAGFPIRVLPIIMFVSTYLQQSLTPTDSRQKMTMIFMNLFMLVIFYNLPSGLVLYWTVTNLLTAAQMYLIHRGDIRQQSKPA